MSVGSQLAVGRAALSPGIWSLWATNDTDLYISGSVFKLGWIISDNNLNQTVYHTPIITLPNGRNIFPFHSTFPSLSHFSEFT